MSQPTSDLLPEEYLERIHAILETVAGRQVRAYKASSLSRRILLRQQLSGQSDPEDYLQWLQENPDEAHGLAAGHDGAREEPSDDTEEHEEDDRHDDRMSNGRAKCRPSAAATLFAGKWPYRDPSEQHIHVAFVALVLTASARQARR